MSKLSDRLARPTEVTPAMKPPRTDELRAAPEAEVGVQPRGLPLPEAQAAYDAARTTWLDALRQSKDGKNRTLARLAVAQKAYEEADAALELSRAEDALAQQRLEALRRRREEVQRRAAAIASQATEWNKVHETPPAKKGLFGRILRRR
jgi:hypothetical protein